MTLKLRLMGSSNSLAGDGVGGFPLCVVEEVTTTVYLVRDHIFRRGSCTSVRALPRAGEV
jgi:hypothetical protein